MAAWRPSFPSDFPKPAPTERPWWSLPRTKLGKEGQKEGKWQGGSGRGGTANWVFIYSFIYLVGGWGVAESRKKFYFYLEQNSQGDRVLILAFQTGCSWWSGRPLTDGMSQTKHQLVFLHPCPHPKEWTSSRAEARRSKDEVVGLDSALLLASESLHVQCGWVPPSPTQSHPGPPGPIPGAGLPGPPRVPESPCQSRHWAMCPGWGPEAVTSSQTLRALLCQEGSGSRSATAADAG